jgi:hypothetical protein
MAGGGAWLTSTFAVVAAFKGNDTENAPPSPAETVVLKLRELEEWKTGILANLAQA